MSETYKFQLTLTETQHMSQCEHDPSWPFGERCLLIREVPTEDEKNIHGGRYQVLYQIFRAFRFRVSDGRENEPRCDPFVERDLSICGGRQCREELRLSGGLPREDGKCVAGLIE